ncbi:MAG: hypothetical protein ACJ74H_17740 [Thermoanaerobaculia bacterium]
MSVSECSDALAAAVARLDPVLQPLGFRFVADANGEAHMAFASGFFVGSAVKIGLIFRKRGTFGCVIYENENSNMSHSDLMQYLGAQDRQRLLYSDSIMTSVARGGGDPIDALISDLGEVVGDRLNDRDLMDRLIARSLNERFPGLMGNHDSVESTGRQAGHARGLIRRMLDALKHWRSK